MINLGPWVANKKKTKLGKIYRKSVEKNKTTGGSSDVSCEIPQRTLIINIYSWVGAECNINWCRWYRNNRSID